jgi:signal transduction histidine kinase
LSKQDKLKSSEVHINVAFEIIRDDISKKIKENTKKVHDFLDQVSAISWELLWYQKNPDKKLFFSNPTYSSYINNIGKEVEKFSSYMSADKIRIYTKDKRLLISFEKLKDKNNLKTYIQTKNGVNSYLDIKEYSRLLITKANLPVKKIPNNIDSNYKTDIPDKVMFENFYEGNKIGLRTIKPIFNLKDKVGVIIVESFYKKNLLERFANLSKAEVDLYSNKIWLFGTSNRKKSIDKYTITNSQSCLDESNDSFNIVKNKLFYRSVCLLKNSSNNVVGAISVDISRITERQEIFKTLRNVIYITIITIVLSFALAVFSSMGTIKFIKKLTSTTTEIVKGNLEQDINISRSDELSVLAQGLLTMRDSIKDRLAELKKEIIVRRKTEEDLRISENNLANQYNQLEVLVDERTSELLDAKNEIITQMEQLKKYQSRIVAQEKLASLGTLASGVAHEIQNPLHMIMNATHIIEKIFSSEIIPLIQNSNIKDNSEEHIDEIETNILNMLEMILRNIKRSSTIIGKMQKHSRSSDLKLDTTNLKVLLSNTIEIACDKYQAENLHNLEINKNLEELGDFLLIEQDISIVIQNLLNNALYSLEEKLKIGQDESYSPSLDIKLYSIIADEAIIVIKDNGIGIPKNALDKVLDPFFTNKPPGKGTGLGLYIVNDIISAYGGEINIESVMNKYTEVKVTLKRNPDTIPFEDYDS